MPISSEPQARRRPLLRWLMRALLAVGALVIAGLIGLAALVYYQGTHPWKGPAQYVALGSSLAAGPGIFPHEGRSPLLCAQSERNYPHQVARDLGLSLVDRTCSGATTRHVLWGGQYFQPPQIDAVGPDTRLVTVTIGGNDANYAGDIVAHSCAKRGMLRRLLVSCTPWPQAKVDAGLARAGENLRRIGAEIHRRAPDARLVFVGYFRLFPETGTCPGLGVDAQAADRARRVAGALNDLTHDAAVRSGAAFIDLAELGRGHDACSDDPWINGAFPQRRLAAPFHPNLRGMTAAARAVKAEIRKPAG